MKTSLTPELLAIALGTPARRTANVPFLFWSDPGFGKTSQIEDALQLAQWAYKTLSPDHDETVYGLVPVIDAEAKRLTTYPHVWTDALFTAARSCIVLDDITGSTGPVHAAQLRLLTHLETAGLALPPTCAIVALANPSAAAANGRPLRESTASRFVHVRIERSATESAELALRGFRGDERPIHDLLTQIKNGFEAAYVRECELMSAYLATCPSLRAKDEVEELDVTLSVSDRSAEMATRIVAAARCIDAKDLIPVLLGGAIGRPHAVGYSAYSERRNIPTMQAVLQSEWRPSQGESDIAFVVLTR